MQHLSYYMHCNMKLSNFRDDGKFWNVISPIELFELIQERHGQARQGCQELVTKKGQTPFKKRAKFWILLNKLFEKKGQTLNKPRLEKKANYLINFEANCLKKRAKFVIFGLEKANLATLGQEGRGSSFRGQRRAVPRSADGPPARPTLSRACRFLRAGHLRYFWICSIIKDDFFCIYYHVNLTGSGLFK